jgi:hypothetical protein
VLSFESLSPQQCVVVTDDGATRVIPYGGHRVGEYGPSEALSEANEAICTETLAGVGAHNDDPADPFHSVNEGADIR